MVRFNVFQLIIQRPGGKEMKGKHRLSFSDHSYAYLVCMHRHA